MLGSDWLIAIYNSSFLLKPDNEFPAIISAVLSQHTLLITLLRKKNLATSNMTFYLTIILGAVRRTTPIRNSFVQFEHHMQPVAIHTEWCVCVGHKRDPCKKAEPIEMC